MLESVRQQVLQVALNMTEAGLIRGTEGNISMRDPSSGHLAITPTGVPYLQMEVDDIVVIDDGGNLVWSKPGRAATSESPMHTLVYRERLDVGAVVHSHSPYAVVLSVAQRPIPIITIALAIVVGRRVPVAPYCRPGTEELGRSALAAMNGGNATLLGSHGVLTVARNLETAAQIALVVEDAARIFYMASAIGQPFELPSEEVVYLIDLAHRFGRKEA